MLWSAVASPTQGRTTPIFKVRLHQGFAAGEMGFAEKILNGPCHLLFSNSGRALALPATDDDADHSFHVPARSGRKDAQVLGEVLDAFAGWLGDVIGSDVCKYGWWRY